MKTITQITSEISKVSFGYYDKQKDEFIEINDDNRGDIAKKFDCSEKLLEMIEENFAVFRDTLKEDLEDIWGKIPT